METPASDAEVSPSKLVTNVLAELTRLSAYIACQGCGGPLVKPNLLGGCAHCICSLCASRAISGRNPCCPVRGCDLPVFPKDLTPDTTTAHIVECIRLLEQKIPDISLLAEKQSIPTQEGADEEDWLMEDEACPAGDHDSPCNDVVQASSSHNTESFSTVSPPPSEMASDDRLVVCLSKLSSDIRKKCEDVCRRFGVEFVREFPVEGLKPAVVVTKLEDTSSSSENSREVCEISFSVLFGMIRRLDIVSFEWLLRCDELGRLLDRKEYLASAPYMRESTPVFDGVAACFELGHENRVRSDISRLIIEGGGQIIHKLDSIEPSRFRLQILIVPDMIPCDSNEDLISVRPALVDDRIKRVDFAWLADCVKSGICPPANQDIFETCIE